MPVNQTANLLDYFNQNTPASSQATSIPAMTYPAIGSPGAVSATDVFNNSYALGFTPGFTPGQPSKYVGIDATGTSMSQPLIPAIGNVNYFANSFSLGFTSAMQNTQFSGISGVPGTMAFSAQGSTMSSTVSNPATPMNTTSTPTLITSNPTPLDSLVGGVNTPPNNLSPTPTLTGTIDAYRGNTIATLGISDYMNNTYAPGFTDRRGSLDPSEVLQSQTSASTTSTTSTSSKLSPSWDNCSLVLLTVQRRPS